MKGQIQQVFIYIMALLVIGFLVVVGGKMIFGVLDDRCSVEEGSFITALQREISSSTQYGTKHTVTINAPCEHTMFCIVSANAVDAGESSMSFFFEDYLLPSAQQHLADRHADNIKIIKKNTQDKIPYNMYLAESGPTGKLLPIAFDARLTTPGVSPSEYHAVCVEKKNGVFKFRFEGLGRNGILVKPVDS